MRLRRVWKALATIAILTHLGFSQSSLAGRVLLVYNPADANSTEVAAHYQTARGVPNGNLCRASVSTTNSTILYSDYVNLLRTPIRSCLNTAGPQSILYIVLAYLRPLAIQAPSGQNYSVDSFLSDVWDQYATQFFSPAPTAVHRYYAESQSQGNVFIPFQSLAAYRATPRTQLIYSVWRLDGATPAIAEAEVDNALAATGGPISQVAGSLANACVDMIAAPQGNPDSGYNTGNWDLYRVAGFITAAHNLNLITDTQSTSFGQGSSPQCPNTGIYAGWYNYGTYNDAFSWDKGSIGWDLDSGALADTRGGVWWGPNAIARGITVTSGPVAEPYLEGIARPAVIRNLLEGANVGDAFLRNTRWLKWMIVNVGDPLYQPFPGGVAPFKATVPANSMAVYLSQATFRYYVGGTPLGVTVMLASPAPSGGLTMTLTPNTPGLSFPPSVTIPAGETSATVTGTTATVTAQTDVQLTASAGSVSATNTISVLPLLAGAAFDSNPAKGGAALKAAVNLYGDAPIGRCRGSIKQRHAGCRRRSGIGNRSRRASTGGIQHHNQSGGRQHDC